MSNEYRLFPVFFSANMCAEYNKNSFGFKDMAAKYSNIAACNVKKVYLLASFEIKEYPFMLYLFQGAYYIRNLEPDWSKFPPQAPRGSYKVTAQFSLHSHMYAQVDYYARIVDKPVDWKKIPKSVETRKQRQ